VIYDPSGVPANPNMQPLMQKMMKGVATEDEKKEFGRYWQERVKEILTNTESYPSLIKIIAT
jgi:hypothetical protein